MILAEFDGIRAKLYEKAMSSFPNAREHDIEIMFKLLNPVKGDKILGIGEGNGYFCRPILERIGPEGEYLVTDPSKDQLENLLSRVKPNAVKIQISGAQDICVAQGHYDKAWSFGAFHHCPNQAEATKRIYSGLKQNGRLVLCDVFEGSNLAKHFDTFVSKYCISGHNVNFLSERSAKKMCLDAGFSADKIDIIDLDQKWHFSAEKEIGEFIYGLHALTFLTGTYDERIEKTLYSCRNILGISYENGNYMLNWPMKSLIAEK